MAGERNSFLLENDLAFLSWLIERSRKYHNVSILLTPRKNVYDNRNIKEWEAHIKGAREPPCGAFPRPVVVIRICFTIKETPGWIAGLPETPNIIAIAHVPKA